jgi:hypothetical protein
MDIETKIQEIKDEQSEINDNVILIELFTEMPLKNLYRNYEIFKLQVLQTEGDDIYDKYINCSRNKCRMRIDYLENKLNLYEEHLEVKNDQVINEILQEMIDELNYEKEALEYFNEFYA